MILGAYSPANFTTIMTAARVALIHLSCSFTAAFALAQLDLIQVLLNAPELDIELVESLSSPLLSIMTIDVGLCVPIELPLSVDAV